jgi:hypothetical protein
MPVVAKTFPDNSPIDPKWPFALVAISLPSLPYGTWNNKAKTKPNVSVSVSFYLFIS